MTDVMRRRGHGEGSRWSQKALFIGLVLLPIVYLHSMTWAWRHRADIRTKSAPAACSTSGSRYRPRLPRHGSFSDWRRARSAHRSPPSACSGPVGEVGLPALVRQVGLEPQVGALGPLARLGRDQPVAGQDPPDRRHRRDGRSVALQVGVECVGAGIQARFGQLLPESDDPSHGVIVGGVRVRPGTGRLLLDRIPAPGPPSGHQLAHPDRRDPVLPGHRSMRLTRQNRLDDDPVLRHPQGLTKTWDRG
jgi:hypothetical protein